MIRPWLPLSGNSLVSRSSAVSKASPSICDSIYVIIHVSIGFPVKRLTEEPDGSISSITLTGTETTLYLLTVNKRLVTVQEIDSLFISTASHFLKTFKIKTIFHVIIFIKLLMPIVHFTVVCLVAKPLNRSEAKGDLVMIQTLLLFKCKLLCYLAK